MAGRTIYRAKVDRKLSDRQLKPTQQQWHEQWAGQVTTVESVAQVDEFLAGILKAQPATASRR